MLFDCRFSVTVKKKRKLKLFLNAIFHDILINVKNVATDTCSYYMIDSTNKRTGTLTIKWIIMLINYCCNLMIKHILV